MDISKAQRLLAKINVLVDNYDGSYSNLEKDLLISYIEDLHTTIGGAPMSGRPKTNPPPAPKIHVDDNLLAPKKETNGGHHRVSAPIVEIADIPAPPAPEEDKLESKPLVDVSVIEHEPLISKAPIVEKVEIPEVQKEMIPEKQKEPVKSDDHEALMNLFSMKQGADVQSKLSEKPLENIELGMGINDRILTINELFGSDQTLFKTTLSSLNRMDNFEDAKKFLIDGVADEHGWAQDSKKTKAETFIRLVWRRYAHQK